MKKHRYLLWLFLLITNFVIGQNWELLYGDSGHNENGQDVIETYDKGYLLISCDGYTIWVIKTNINGEILWQKNYNNNDKYMYIQKVIETSDHGYAMVGFSVFYDDSDGDPIIIKFNSCFEKEWCRILHKTNRSGLANDIIENENNKLIVLTNGNNDNPDNWVNLYGLTLGGQLLWEKEYVRKEDHPLMAYHSLYDLKQIGNEYFGCGRCYYPYPDNPDIQYQRPFVVGIDENFEEKWILPYGINDSIHGKVWGMNYQSEDTIYCYGFQRYYEVDQEYYKGLLIMFNEAGEELGSFTLENDSVFDEGYDGNFINVKFLDDGKLLGTDLLLTGVTEYFYAEVVFDTLGNVYHVRSHENFHFIKELKTTYNNKFIQPGSYKHSNGDYDALLYKFNENLEPDSIYTATFTYDSLCPYTIESEDIVLDDCFITGIGELPSPKQYYSYIETIPLKIYPNPASNIVHFAMENTEHHSNITLQVYDIYGKLIHEQNIITGQQEAVADVSTWKSGIYAVVVTSTTSAKTSVCVAGKNKFIVR